jgi:hypothetical protein
MAVLNIVALLVALMKVVPMMRRGPIGPADHCRAFAYEVSRGPGITPRTQCCRDDGPVRGPFMSHLPWPRLPGRGLGHQKLLSTPQVSLLV